MACWSVQTGHLSPHRLCLNCHYFTLVTCLVYTFHTSDCHLRVTLSSVDVWPCLEAFFKLPQEGDQFHQSDGVWVWGPFGRQWALHSASELKNLCENAEVQSRSLPLSPRQGWVSSVVRRPGLIGQSDDVKFNHSLEKCWIKEASEVNYPTCSSHQKPERLSLEDPGERGRAGLGSYTSYHAPGAMQCFADWNLGRESCSRTLAFWQLKPLGLHLNTASPKQPSCLPDQVNPSSQIFFVLHPQTLQHFVYLQPWTQYLIF